MEIDIFFFSQLVLTVTAAHGDHSHAHQLVSPHDTPTPLDVLPVGSQVNQDPGRLKKTTGRSSRVLVNTSVPFSVAPQPVKNTPEVALAREHFMLVFEKIKEAVLAADHEHFNVTSVGDNVKNDIHHHLHDHQHHHSHAETTTSHHSHSHHQTHYHDDPLSLFTPKIRMNFFPDPVTEPDYFLPSVQVDPQLMKQLYPPLPPDPYVQEMRLLGENDNGGMCYEFIILEPEPETHNGDDDDSSASISSPEQSSSEESSTRPMEDSTSSKFVGLLVQGDTSALQASSAAPASKSSRFQIHQAQDVHDTDSSATKSVPAHFKVPVLSFLSPLRGDVPKHH